MSDKFLILCREHGVPSRNLRNVLQAKGEVVIIPDKEAPGLTWFTDDEMEGYGGLVSHSLAGKSVTAWERAWKWLALNRPAPDERVWFVEDDVAANAGIFARLIEESAAVDADLSATEIFTRADDPGWYHWSRATGWFDDPARSFNPLCRLSARLATAVLDFRETHGQFIFHEILFPSLLSELGLPYLDWKEDRKTAALFESFRYRQVLDAPRPGVCHPVKSPDLHSEICEGV